MPYLTRSKKAVKSEAVPVNTEKTQPTKIVLKSTIQLKAAPKRKTKSGKMMSMPVVMLHKPRTVLIPGAWPHVMALPQQAPVPVQTNAPMMQYHQPIHPYYYQHVPHPPTYGGYPYPHPYYQTPYGHPAYNQVRQMQQMPVAQPHIIPQPTRLNHMPPTHQSAEARAQSKPTERILLPPLRSLYIAAQQEFNIDHTEQPPRSRSS